MTKRIGTHSVNAEYWRSRSNQYVLSVRVLRFIAVLNVKDSINLHLRFADPGE